MLLGQTPTVLHVSEELRITALCAKNIRLFKEFSIGFNNRFNFIVGPNGTGKTSILRLIAMCLSSEGIYDSRFCEGNEVWMDFVGDGKNYRTGYGTQNGVGSIKSVEYMKVQIPFPYYPPEGADVRMRPDEVDRTTPFLAPLFLGAYRRIDYRKIDGMKRELSCEDQRKYFRNNAAESLKGTVIPDVKQWLINRYFISGKPWAQIEKANWDWLIENFGYFGPSGMELGFMEILADLEPKLTFNGEMCYLEELSAGVQAVLSLILSILEWVESTNIEERRLVKNAIGTVIVDELDVHLHPDWQLTIRDTLERLFPRLQFIVTTHSPHIIASAREGEILKLPLHEGTVHVRCSKKSYSGWNTDQILEDVMDVTQLKNKLHEQLVTKAANAVIKKDIVGLQKSIEDLAKVSHPNDVIVSTFKIELATMLLEAEHDKTDKTY